MAASNARVRFTRLGFLLVGCGLAAWLVAFVLKPAEKGGGARSESISGAPSAPSTPDVTPVSPEPAVSSRPPAEKTSGHEGIAISPPERPSPVSVDETEPDEEGLPEDLEYLRELEDIEDIKQELYALDIATVAQLYLLDYFVQTGDAEPRDLWQQNWGSVDDFKATDNGFNLEMADDGTMIFVPDRGTADLYTFTEQLAPYEYDPEYREFVSEVDYYGKPILNVLKFLKDDVLVMMTISGEKVDLNIYQKGDGE